MKLVAKVYGKVEEVSPIHLWVDSGSQVYDIYQIDKYIVIVAVSNGEIDSDYEYIMGLFGLPLGYMYGVELDPTRFDWEIPEVVSVDSNIFLDTVKSFGLIGKEYNISGPNMKTKYLWASKVAVGEIEVIQDGKIQVITDELIWLQYDSVESAKKAFFEKWAESLILSEGTDYVLKINPSQVVSMFGTEDFLCESGILSINAWVGSEELRELIKVFGLESGLFTQQVRLIVKRFNLTQEQESELLNTVNAEEFIELFIKFNVELNDEDKVSIESIFEKFRFK